MVLLIASYSGITEITAIIAIAGANVAMILFGWLQEQSNPPDRTRTTMRPFWFGTIAGIAPWIAIWFNVVTADEVPGFVVGIVVALVGAVWVLQGLNSQLAPQSFMTGSRIWLIIGLATFVGGSVLAWSSWNRR